jgi:hypothetical protein
VSYDLAVWEGERPADDETALEMFRALYEQHIEAEELAPPSPRIRAYAEALLKRYPDITDAAGQDSPWSSGPLIGEAVGPLMYFPMMWSRGEEVSAWAAQLAAEHGLVCYDPQLECLRP